MGNLRVADLRTLVEVVADLGAADDAESFALCIVTGLQRLIPAEAIAYNEIDLRAGAAFAVVDPPEIKFAGSEEVLSRYGAQNPLVAHAIREPHTRPLKISDFSTRREWHRTDLYDCLFRPVGLEYQMACGLPAAPGLVVGISLNRSSRDFSQRDLALLDLLRPHLVRAQERSAARQRARTTLLQLERAVDGAGRAVIAVDKSGAIRFASPQARRWLEEYLPPPPDESVLPEPLATWQRQRRANVREGGRASGDDVLEVGGDSRNLSVRSVFEMGSEEHLLVFEEHQAAPSDQLTKLGLTPRQAEILYLVAAGRSDREIAGLLSVSEHTVGKHLEHIFIRLGVSTRTAAAAAAWQTAHRTNRKGL